MTSTTIFWAISTARSIACGRKREMNNMPSPYAGFTTNLLNSVDAAVKGFTQNAYQAIVQAHQTEINLALVLYVSIFGYLVLTGEIEFTLRRAVRHLITLGIVAGLAT